MSPLRLSVSAPVSRSPSCASLPIGVPPSEGANGAYVTRNSVAGDERMPSSASVWRNTPSRTPRYSVSVLSFCVVFEGSKIAMPSTPESVAAPAMLMRENPSCA